MSFKHILVTTDFSEASAKALEYLSFNSVLSERCTLLYVFEDWNPPVGFHWILPSEFDRPEWHDRVMSEVRDKLDSLIRMYGQSRRIEEKVLQTRRHPAAEICDYAHRERCDLIIMGSKGAGAIASMLMGSVVQQVVHSASCPVMVIPSQIQIPNLMGVDEV
jgi:nucleotide-binding universal stress UspA family protein